MHIYMTKHPSKLSYSRVEKVRHYVCLMFCDDWESAWMSTAQTRLECSRMNHASAMIILTPFHSKLFLENNHTNTARTQVMGMVSSST
eukprot:scaffold653761_cov63-Attheya_sp.AAC.1